MREFLKNLGLDAKTIDSIMAEHGKVISKDKEELQTLKQQVVDLKENSRGSIELRRKYDELTNKIKQEEAEKKKQDEENQLMSNISEVIGDKKFVNEYTKNSIMNEVKTALQDKANVGKSAKDLFEAITKDKNDIFVNPNAVPDMTPMAEMDETISKEAFDKMSYMQRLEFKAENPELFKKYNN